MNRPLRVHLGLGAIVGLALVVRLLHAWYLADTAFPRIPLVFTVSDMHGYLEWAERIRGGDLLGRDTYHPAGDWILVAAERGWTGWAPWRRTFHWTPFYPYALAAFQALFGPSSWRCW